MISLEMLSMTNCYRGKQFCIIVSDKERRELTDMKETHQGN